jgi:hypothetical protein
VLVTAGLVAAVYAVATGGQAGWASARTTGALAGAVVLLAAFGARELKAASPLVPLRLLRLRNLATANAVGVLWAAAMFATFFLTALYLQLVLGYSPLATGLAFLPVNLIMAGLSVGLSAVEALVPRGPAAPPGHAAPPGADQVQAVPLTVKPDGAVSLLVQVPWKPSEMLPPGLIAAL